MLNRRALFAGLLLVVIFGFAVAHLFVLRFAKGDIYPPSSTLRADPLGAKALADALDGIDGLQVSRNYRSLDLLPKEGRPVIFYLGMPARYFAGEADLDTLNQQVRAGARLIIAFQTESEPFDLEKEARERERQHPKKKKDQKTDEKDPDAEKAAAVFTGSDLWKVKIVSLKANSPARSTLPGLEREISTHSHTAFEVDPSVWQTIYSTIGTADDKDATDRKPVVVERKHGLGSIVLCADSWLFSNEALRLERRPALLAWLLGDHTRVVFDETHFGVHEQPGIATLARRYRLHGAVAVCLLLGILFVWRNAVPLVPPVPNQPTSTALSGHDAGSGLANLLRRAIPLKNITATCLAEWQKSPPRPLRQTDLEIAAGLARDPAKSPLDRYHALAKLLKIHVPRT